MASGAQSASTGWKIVIDVANDADTGGALSLTNIRFEGDVIESAPLVPARCGLGGYGDGGWLQPFTLYLDESPATYGSGAGLAVDPASLLPEGEVATVRISAGEVKTIEFSFSDMRDELGSGRSAVGRIVADMVSPESGEIVLLDDVEVRGLLSRTTSLRSRTRQRTACGTGRRCTTRTGTALSSRPPIYWKQRPQGDRSGSGWR